MIFLKSHMVFKKEKRCFRVKSSRLCVIAKTGREGGSVKGDFWCLSWAGGSMAALVLRAGGQGADTPGMRPRLRVEGVSRVVNVAPKGAC